MLHFFEQVTVRGSGLLGLALASPLLGVGNAVLPLLLSGFGLSAFASALALLVASAKGQSNVILPALLGWCKTK